MTNHDLTKLHPLIAFKLPFHRFNLKIFVHALALDPTKKQEKEFLINLGWQMSKIVQLKLFIL